MAKIIRSPRAKADVLSVGRHIAEQSQSHSTAYRFLDKIDEKIQFLARHPLAGEARPDLGADVRAFPVGR